MIKINLNFNIENLNGTKFGNAGEILGQHLVASTKGEALKYYDWAVAISKGLSIDLDNADFKKIREFVELHEHLPILVKAPIIIALDKAKEENDKENKPKK